MDHLNDNVHSVEEVVFVLLETLKANGTFDEFRRDCVSNIDAKPTFQNWKQRIESNINKFLSKINYTPELNKNSIRERLRKHLFDGRESREIEDGADRILTQVFASRTLNVFETKIENAVNEYLGIKNEKTIEQNGMQASCINVNNLTKVSINSTNSDDNQESPSNHTDNAEVTSPEFEPLISGMDNENSNDESISGMSDLNSIGGSPVQCTTKNNLETNSNGINSEKSSIDKLQSIPSEKNGISPKNDDDDDNVTDVNKNTNDVEKHKISDNSSKSKHHSSVTDKQSKEKSSSNHHHKSDKSKDRSSNGQEKSDVKKSSSSKDKKSSSHSKHRSESRDKDRKHRSDKKSHHSDRERTPKRDRKDSRSDMKDKSSSLCKEPKSTNDNRSDDESNAGGSSKQQKSSLHKNRSSTSEKSKSSSSNHKSGRKDNGNKDDAVKSKDKLLESSKHSTRKNSTSKKHEKKSKKESNCQNDLFSNNDQDMANVLLSIGGTVVPYDNERKTEDMTLGQREKIENTQDDIHDKLSESSQTILNVEETDKQGGVKTVSPMQNASTEIPEDLLELNDYTKKTEEPHKDILSRHNKLNVVVTSEKNGENNPVKSISDFPLEQKIEKITEINELVDSQDNIEKKSRIPSSDSSILRNVFISSDLKEKDLTDTVKCQDENISVKEVFKCKNPLQKIEQLNCDIKTSNAFDISDVSMDKDKITVLNNILTTKTIQSPKELNYLNEIPTPNKVGMILKLKKVGLNKYKRKSSTGVEFTSKKVRSSKNITFLNEIDIFQKNVQCKSNNVKIDNHVGSETKTIVTNSTSVQCSVVNDSEVLNDFIGFTESQAVPCQNYLNLKNLLDNYIVDTWKFEGFAPTEVIPCKNREKVYAEVVKLKGDEEFYGFTDEEARVCFGYEQVKQHLEQAKQQFITWLKSQHEAVGGGNGTQNGRNINEMMAVLYENDKITDIKSNIIYSRPNKSNSNLEEISTTPNNNNRNEITTSSHWVAEQEMKYKLLPVKVKLERLLESRSNGQKRNNSQVRSNHFYNQCLT
ncbi:biorientation of chromosomes in cell division protein 1-like 1 [Adelges cooleyi]|uniref:biorientation of chromosomes in cell division protein 1-like 1 n=1 Tax=Adelges cooleyi TaxID=133065 RepID=UPI0021806303|nr:biorientation of chromosomes in cell division protein 1-like 1 [Adelges cooleyi]